MNDNNWKSFIDSNLTESNQFEEISCETVGDTYIEKFRLNKNPQTEIKVGYIRENLLIYFTIFNPTVPGYNQYSRNEFFYKYDWFT